MSKQESIDFLILIMKSIENNNLPSISYKEVERIPYKYKELEHLVEKTIITLVFNH